MRAFRWIALQLEMLGLRFKRAVLEHAEAEYGEDRSVDLVPVNARIDAITRELAA